MLLVSFIHFVVSSLSQLNRSWARLTNAPMPQPLSVFRLCSEGKIGSYRFRGSVPLSYSRAREIVLCAFEAIGISRQDYSLCSI